MADGSKNALKKSLALSSAVALVFVSGCATHRSETEPMREAWYWGDTSLAQSRAISAAKDDESSADSLIWMLEKGAVARANNDVAYSAESFSKADALVRKYEDEPDISVTDETSGILLNQSFTVYKGYDYDKIMLCVYQALNCMEQKEFDKAAVYLRRLENFQAEAKRRNAERIAKEGREIAEAQKNSDGGSYNVDKSLATPEVRSALAQYYGDAFMKGVSAAEAEALYVNPFAYWLAGLYFANKFEDNSDKERAATFFRLAYETSGGRSAAILADMLAAEELASGRAASFGNITYVVYEAGSAPIREQFRIDLPLYIVARHVPHVGINFPYLKPIESYKPTLRIETSAGATETELVADMDAIIRREFDSNLPTVITKTVLSSAIKAGGQYAAQRAAGDDWGILVAIAGSIYQTLTNDADLRTWTTLPKQISIARIETPPDGVVYVDGTPINVDTDGVNVILAKKMSAYGTLILREFNFKDKQ